MSLPKIQAKVSSGRVAYTCPKCHRDVKRTSRTTLDKIIGLILPVRRYKCGGCFWEGIKIHHGSNSSN